MKSLDLLTDTSPLQYAGYFLFTIWISAVPFNFRPHRKETFAKTLRVRPSFYSDPFSSRFNRPTQVRKEISSRGYLSLLASLLATSSVPSLSERPGLLTTSFQCLCFAVLPHLYKGFHNPTFACIVSLEEDYLPNPYFGPYLTPPCFRTTGPQQYSRWNIPF